MPEILAQGWIPDLDLAGGIETVVDWLQDSLGVVFTLVRDVVGWGVEQTETLLTLLPTAAMIVVLTLIAFAAKRWAFAAFTAVAFTFIATLGLFEDTMLTLALVLVAALLAVVIGVPVGILAARNDTVSAAVKPVLDFMQTMPSFIYLLLAVVFFRIGVVPGTISSLVFAMPPAVRLTELGIRQVDAEVVEAAEAFGARPREVLTGVQLPLARASIMAGVNQVIMLALSMVVIAGLAGAGGLGERVVSGVQRLQVGLGVEAGLAVVILAIFLDRATAAFGTGARHRTGTS
ncbi:ABC transporter permease [Euzebya sp.]|uniref:ABC transporter permease n=1 Tax=Euzebya sp. TaxID=1971409 RepID=UPI0035140E77